MPSARAPARNVSGAGFPRRCSHAAVDHRLEQIVDARRDEDVTTVLARGDDRPVQARLPNRTDIEHRACVCLDAAAPDQRHDELVLPVAQADDGLGARRIARVALGQLDPT
jgi:hypothetical protein